MLLLYGTLLRSNAHTTHWNLNPAGMAIHAPSLLRLTWHVQAEAIAREYWHVPASRYLSE